MLPSQLAEIFQKVILDNGFAREDFTISYLDQDQIEKMDSKKTASLNVEVEVKKGDVLRFEQVFLKTLNEHQVIYDHTSDSRAPGKFTIYPFSENFTFTQLNQTFKKFWQAPKVFPVQDALNMVLSDLFSRLPYGARLVNASVVKAKEGSKQPVTKLEITNTNPSAITNLYMTAIYEALKIIAKPKVIKDGIETEANITNMQVELENTEARAEFLSGLVNVRDNSLFAAVKETLKKMTRPTFETFDALRHLDLLERTFAEASHLTHTLITCDSDTSQFTLQCRALNMGNTQENHLAISSLQQTLREYPFIEITSQSDSFSIKLKPNNLPPAFAENEFKQEFLTHTMSAYIAQRAAAGLMPNSHFSSTTFNSNSSELNTKIYDDIVGQEENRWVPLIKGIFHQYVADKDARKQFVNILHKQIVDNNYFAISSQTVMNKPANIEYLDNRDAKRDFKTWYEYEDLIAWAQLQISLSKTKFVNKKDRKTLYTKTEFEGLCQRKVVSATDFVEMLKEPGTGEYSILKDLSNIKKDDGARENEIRSFLNHAKAFFDDIRLVEVTAPQFEVYLQSFFKKHYSYTQASTHVDLLWQHTGFNIHPNNSTSSNSGMVNARSSMLIQQHFESLIGKRTSAKLVIIDADLMAILNDKKDEKLPCFVHSGIMIGKKIIHQDPNGTEILVTNADKSGLKISSFVDLRDLVLDELTVQKLGKVLDIKSEYSNAFTLQAAKELDCKVPSSLAFMLKLKPGKFAYSPPDSEEVIEFASHETLDTYCSNRRGEIYYQNNGADWEILKGFDRGHYCRYKQKNLLVDKPGSDCPFGDPTVSGSFPVSEFEGKAHTERKNVFK